MEIDPQQLPEDAALLRQIVLQLLQAVEDKDRLLPRLQHQVEQLLRNRYGPRRERVDENQLFLIAAQILAASQKEPPGREAAGPPSGDSSAAGMGQAQWNGHGRQPLPETLERRRVLLDLDESQRQCPHCQKPMKRIGEEISERLEFVPASLQVVEEVRPKYACASGCGAATAPKLPAPIDKGLPGAGLLAHIAVSQYGDHLPLYRQEGIFRRQGVKLSRQTMSDWMRQCAELASPRELFAIEQHHLKPLPVWVPPVYRLHQRLVDVEGYVRVDTNRYSVPDDLIGRHVEVRQTKDHVEIYRGPRLVATHSRVIEPTGRKYRLPEQAAEPFHQGGARLSAHAALSRVVGGGIRCSRPVRGSK